MRSNPLIKFSKLSKSETESEVFLGTRAEKGFHSSTLGNVSPVLGAFSDRTSQPYDRYGTEPNMPYHAPACLRCWSGVGDVSKIGMSGRQVAALGAYRTLNVNVHLQTGRGSQGRCKKNL